MSTPPASQRHDKHPHVCQAFRPETPVLQAFPRLWSALQPSRSSPSGGFADLDRRFADGTILLHHRLKPLSSSTQNDEGPMGRGDITVRCISLTTW